MGASGLEIYWIFEVDLRSNRTNSYMKYRSYYCLVNWDLRTEILTKVWGKPWGCCTRPRRPKIRSPHSHQTLRTLSSSSSPTPLKNSSQGFKFQGFFPQFSPKFSSTYVGIHAWVLFTHRPNHSPLFHQNSSVYFKGFHNFIPIV